MVMELTSEGHRSAMAFLSSRTWENSNHARSSATISNLSMF